jgi:predicted RNA-binding Zn-ribbon protein involved in translation (DUF1610 family)
MTRCPHGMYSSDGEGFPSAYCSGCTDLEPILRPDTEQQVYYLTCPTCGEELVADYELATYSHEVLGCPECGYDGTE